MTFPILLVAAVLLGVQLASAMADAAGGRAGDEMLDAYFRAETTALRDRCLADVKTLADWAGRRDELRRQLAEMLGLWPPSQRTDLKATVTGRSEQAAYTIERIHFQSRPGLYVTGNVYVPKGLTKPAPAILYVCGHSTMKKDGIAYGSKTTYQHHADWFARNGYVCLVVDTVELGEIEGFHHGLYREKMWWWLSRGYTPAGVEAWNGMRAIDYLTARADVDGDRIGVTGRSGGGAATWWIAAMDERVKCAVPVAGITDLWNHVVDGCVEGHCDCMYMVNTYRWDYAQVAALVAPRALLIGNTDKDTIFPLDGVQRLHAKVRGIYQLYGADEKLGLLITEGPHKDTQDLQVPAFRWFNRFLKDDTAPIDAAIAKPLPPEQLRVFAARSEPADQINTRAHEFFVAAAGQPAVPKSEKAWARQREEWTASLRQKTFGGWPSADGPLDVSEPFVVKRQGLVFRAVDFTSQTAVRLRLYLLSRDDGARPAAVTLRVHDERTWSKWLAAMTAGFAAEMADQRPLPAPDENGFVAMKAALGAKGEVIAWVAPRGIGPTAWTGDEKRQTQIRRRFWLLGQTLEGMRVYDVRRAIQAVRIVEGLRETPLQLAADDEMAAVAVYAAVFEPGVARLELSNLPRSHAEGPQLLNVLKTLDLPAAVALAAERSPVRITQGEPGGWQYPAAVAAAMGWAKDRFVVRVVAGEAEGGR